MPRMSKNHPMTGSIKKDKGFKIAYFTYKDGTYYVQDKVAKKNWGPYSTTKAAREDGVMFYADGGRRAGLATAAK